MRIIEGRLITPSGRFKILPPDLQDTWYSFEGLVKRFGDIEIKSLRGKLSDYVLVCDHVGREAGQAINPFASNLYGYIIAGDVLVIKRSSLEKAPPLRSMVLDLKTDRRVLQIRRLRGGYQH